MKLSENIRAIRREKGLKQEQLAEAMGVSTASVSKWETGQSAPELTILMELADCFGVSVDTLLGHEIPADRMEALIREMEALSEDGDHRGAQKLAEKLLRSYPNSYRAVEQAANLYHNTYLFTMDRSAMDRAIELTQRLFALLEDPTGPKRYELLSKMANHYEMLDDWDMAMKYYTEGNVGRVNDRALARCLANAGKNQESVRAVSEVFQQSLFALLTDCIMLEQLWQALDQPEKAEAALRWGCNALEAAGSDLADQFSLLSMTMYAELAKAEEQAGKPADADAHIRRAVRIARDGTVGSACPCFLDLPEIDIQIMEPQQGTELLQRWLEKEENQRLRKVAEEEIRM